MLNPDAFLLSMESELKLRVITDEVTECKDLAALKENLLGLVKLNLHYQQMLSVILKEQLESQLKKLT